MAIARTVLITLSIVTMLIGMVLPPLHIVSIPLMLITAVMLVIMMLDKLHAAARRR